MINFQYKGIAFGKYVEGKILKDECQKIIQDFFLKKR